MTRRQLNISAIADADGLTPDERDTVYKLLAVWRAKLARNSLRAAYYDAHVGLKNIGIAVPKELELTDLAVGWPYKAVSALANRTRFDGFSFPEGVDGKSANALESALRSARFKAKYSKAANSALVHSCAFASVARGAKGGPPVSIRFHDAEHAAALWDEDLERVSYGMNVARMRQVGRTARFEPCQVNVHTPEFVLELSRLDDGGWSAVRKPHPYGRPMFAAIAYNADLERPFGRSRISRAVMSITDCAVRTAMRAELGAEFFTSPQKYLLGADDDAFDKPKWQAYIGSIFLAGKDKDGDVPTFGQLSQGSMQPHMDYMRQLAAQFAGETCVPISSLGVIHDNPASAEAIYAAKEDPIIEAQNFNDDNEAALRDIAVMTMAVQQNKRPDRLTDEELGVMCNFRSPAMPSIVSQSDAMVKQATVAPWIAETEVFLEELGYSEEKRSRMLAEKQRATAKSAIAALVASAPKGEGE